MTRENVRRTPAPGRAFGQARRFISAFLMAVLAFAPVAASAGMDPVARGLAASIKPATTSQVKFNNTIIYAGDSITAGGEDGTGVTFPGVVSGLSGYSQINLGVGGQTSVQIAMRAGATPFTLTVASNQLVLGSNSVTAINGNAIVSMATNSAAFQPLSTAADNNSRTLTGTLCGYHGALIRTATGGPPSTAETYTFTPDSISGTQACAANSAFTNDNTAILQNNPVVIDIGRNDYSSQSNVTTSVQNFVNTMGHQNYLCLSIHNGNYAGESSGGGNYNQIITDNNAIKSICGASHYLDTRAYLVANYNPGQPQDVIDHTNDVTPTSLRFDNIHPNAAGYTLMGNLIWANIQGLRSSTFAFLTTYNLPDVLTKALQSPGAIGSLVPNSGKFSGIELTSGGSGIFFTNPATPGQSGKPQWLFAPCNLNAFGSDICFGNTGGNFVNSFRFNLGGAGGLGDPVVIDKSGRIVQKRGILDLGYTYAQPTTGSTVTISDTGDSAIIDPAGTLAALTVTLPTCAATSGGVASSDGKVVHFSTTQAITALTVNSTSGSIAANAPGSATAGQAFAFICRVANTTWYRY